MSTDDEDLAKLMREIDAMNGSPAESAPAPPAPTAAVPATTGSNEVATTDDASSPRAKWTGMAAIGGGVSGFIAGTVLWFLPGVNSISTGIGAAFGAAVVAAISGPPKWLK